MIAARPTLWATTGLIAFAIAPWPSLLASLVFVAPRVKVTADQFGLLLPLPTQWVMSASRPFWSTVGEVAVPVALVVLAAVSLVVAVARSLHPSASGQLCLGLRIVGGLLLVFAVATLAWPYGNLLLALSR
jgi:type II secretory pathway component PulF